MIHLERGYEPNIRVPLITPRINGLKNVSMLTSSLDLYKILFEMKIEEREYIFSDSAYRAQTRRKLSILSKNYKYIYNKHTKTEELYDLSIDIYVPAPWWKTDYFEVRYENPADNKRYFYQLDGEGIRYEIAAFARSIESGKENFYVSQSVSEAICSIIGDFYRKIDVTYI